VFKVRLSDEERAVVRERARGYPSPAEYARRTLVAGWSLPVHRVHRVAQAFIPVQEAIEVARGAGFEAEAARATEALREILLAIGDR
jgi:hypothetical protein